LEWPTFGGICAIIEKPSISFVSTSVLGYNSQTVGSVTSYTTLQSSLRKELLVLKQLHKVLAWNKDAGDSVLIVPSDVVATKLTLQQVHDQAGDDD
jgi:hypothetical protein